MRKEVIMAAAMIMAPMAAVAQTCTEAPSCSSLGYTDDVTSCGSYDFLRCPFDTTKARCLGGGSGGAHVGDLKYSLETANHDGWLKCDGSQYSQTTYAKLYKLIGTNFCKKYTSRADTTGTNKCSSGKFAVPDYRGYFLRALGSADDLYYKGGSGSYSYYIPQYEQLPNIRATWYSGHEDQNNLGTTCTGAISCAMKSGQIMEMTKEGSKTYISRTFDASTYNTIYSGSHVIPAHYAANVFIYAGE